MGQYFRLLKLGKKSAPTPDPLVGPAPMRPTNDDGQRKKRFRISSPFSGSGSLAWWQGLDLNQRPPVCSNSSL